MNLSISVFALPKHTNSKNTIFGGWLLSHLDLAGLVECRNRHPGRYLTVGIEKMKFVKPVFVGDLVKIYTNVERIGKTSMTIKLIAKVNRMDGNNDIVVTEGLFTYVKTNDHNEPEEIKI
jgi:acyl-CoA thioesterase YciA